MHDRAALRRQDFWTALLLAGLSLFFLWKTSEIPFFRANAAGVESGRWYNSAAIVPYAIFATILVLSLGLLVTAIRQGGAPWLRRAVTADAETGGLARLCAVAAIMLFYIFALVPRVDFTIASALVLQALIYGFHETRARATAIAVAAVAIPALYALAMHFPRSEWNTPHDDDWITLAAFVILALVALVETRLSHGRLDKAIAIAPVLSVLVPFLLVIAMAFGFRQNVPNRTGLLFKQVEYHYYVTVKPWLAGKGR